MSGAAESVVVSLGTGLIMLAIGLVVKRVPRQVALTMAAGVAMITFTLWPRATLVEVPDLSNFSRDEADLVLSSTSLVAVPQPQQSPSTRPEHVVPISQNPIPGTKVRRGTVVRYSVSSPLADGSQATGAVSGGRISIFTPRDGGDVFPRRGADNVYRFQVDGAIDGLDPSQSSILLWVQPVQPPSDQPGWYLQRLPANGVVSVSGNSWRGVGQIGNQQYPPNDGDVVDVAVSIVPAEEALRLDARQGPLTAVVLPGVVSKVVRLNVRLN